MKKYLSNIKIYGCLAVIIISIFAPYKAFATDNAFYSSNDILFYNSTDTGCVDVTSSTVTLPDSKTNQETAAKFLTSTNFVGNGNKPMNAVQMAAIIGNLQQESSVNPNSGVGGAHQGIVQWESVRWNKITDPKTDLNNQLNFMKTELDGTYKDSLGEFWNASSLDSLDKATYAIARNYEVGVIQGKTPPTSWTNNADATNNIQDWVKRRAYAQNTYNNLGNLAGSGYSPGPSCGGLVSGGMTLEKAQTFMAEYKNLEPKDWPSGTTGTAYDINGTNCSGGSLANCVAFSQYFVNRYTTKKYVNTSDGRGVVKDLTALGFTDGGHVPKVYSVFSRSTGTYGHTGVVLGIDAANNEIVIGQASCGETFANGVNAVKASLSDFSSNIYTYAYTDGITKGGTLQ